MFTFLIFNVTLLLPLAILHGLLRAELTRALKNRRKWEPALAIAIPHVFGVIAAIVIYTLKRFEPKKMLNPLVRVNRQVQVALSALVALAFLFLIISILTSKKKEISTFFSKNFLGLALLALIPMDAYLLPQLLMKPEEFVTFNESSVGTESLFRAGGYALGILLAVLLMLAIRQVYERLTNRANNLFAFFLLGSVTFDLALRGISSAGRLNLIKLSNPFVFSVLVFEDKSLPYIVTLQVIILVLASLYLFVKHRQVKATYAKPAMKRKAKYLFRQARRWAVACSVFMIMSAVFVTVVHAYVTRPVPLAPKEGYQVSGDSIIIPLSQVEDGHLHRFSLENEGHDIRFIVVRKPNSNAYGVGLDACEICGIAGYFERNDTIVCKRCDVVMNKATIGFKGGCNPVPFPYMIQDEKIIINKADLIKEQKRFPQGE